MWTSFLLLVLAHFQTEETLPLQSKPTKYIWQLIKSLNILRWKMAETFCFSVCLLASFIFENKSTTVCQSLYVFGFIYAPCVVSFWHFHVQVIEEPLLQGICLLPGGQIENCTFKPWKPMCAFLNHIKKIIIIFQIGIQKSIVFHFISRWVLH